MNEEQKLILEMVADGKISPEEAEQLLRAIEETEAAAQSATAESVHRAATRRSTLDDVGELVERAVRDGLSGLDGVLRNVETKLEHKLNDPHRHELRGRLEAKLRRVAEHAARQATRAEERAAERLERVKDRAARAQERIARREERELWRDGRIPGQTGSAPTFVRMFSVDRESVEQTEHLTLAAQSGDRFVFENRVGDVTIVYADTEQIEVEARKIVWGEDRADAEERSAATKLGLIRHGSEVQLTVEHPSFFGVVASFKDTQLHPVVRVPHGTDLKVKTRAGDLFVEAEHVADWELATKVGDVDLKVAADAGFRYTLATQRGETKVDLPGSVDVPAGGSGTTPLNGEAGDGAGRMDVRVSTGDIRLHN